MRLSMGNLGSPPMSWLTMPALRALTNKKTSLRSLLQVGFSRVSHLTGSRTIFSPCSVRILTNLARITLFIETPLRPGLLKSDPHRDTRIAHYENVIGPLGPS